MEKLIRVIRLHPGESVLIVAPEDTPMPPAAVLLAAELPMPDKLTEEIGGLSHMPERCPRPRDLALAAKGYRYLIVENYLVFYTISGQTVQIQRILYGRRNYQNIL